MILLFTHNGRGGFDVTLKHGRRTIPLPSQTRGDSKPDPDPVARMYAVADDSETAILDDLRDQAGLTWECRDENGMSHWTNDEDDTKCGRCGKRRPKKGKA